MHKHIFLLLGLFANLNFNINLVAAELCEQPKKTRVTANIDDLDQKTNRYTDQDIINIYRNFFAEKPDLLLQALKRAKLVDEFEG